MSDRLSFVECVNTCLGNPEFMREWDRLHGSRLACPDSIEGQIDLACGKLEEDAVELYSFIFERIWLPLVDSTAR
jgi:hypothetical protein